MYAWHSCEYLCTFIFDTNTCILNVRKLCEKTSGYQSQFVVISDDPKKEHTNVLFINKRTILKMLFSPF